jgi:hypothetical protein
MKKLDLKTILSSIKVLLSGEEIAEVIETPETIETNLEEVLLVDGTTIISAESFEAEQAVFIIPATEGEEEAEPVPLPIGNYELEDGRILTVEVEGVIASIGDAPAEDETPPADNEEEIENEMISLEEHNNIVAEMQATIDALNEKLNLSATTITDKDTEIDVLKVELSKAPAVKKLTHSPEALAFIAKVNPKNETNNKNVTMFSKILNHIEENKNN